jgi:hypothetical protein
MTTLTLTGPISMVQMLLSPVVMLSRAAEPAAAEERRPLLPVKDLSTNIPPAPPTPPEAEGSRHGPLSALSPTKRVRLALLCCRVIHGL